MAECSSFIPQNVNDKAKKASESLVPKKSEHLYLKEYGRFREWMVKNDITVVNATVMLAYFQDLSDLFSPNTLWSKFSMLKCMLLLRDRVDISSYHELEAFIKRKNKGYEPKKSEVLTRDQVEMFLREAPNDTNLMFKVVVIMGMFGACRTDELVKMEIGDIDDRGSVIVVQIPETKTAVRRYFTIIEVAKLNALSLVREYSSLRPVGVSRFFLSYRNQKCTGQPVGKNTFGSIPSKIAVYLGLANPKLYTTHCLRRTSATLAADGGASMTKLKRLGGWKSSTVAEGYLADSMESKNKISREIAGVEDVPKARPLISVSESRNGNSKQTYKCASSSISFSGKFGNCTFYLSREQAYSKVQSGPSKTS